jgi:hypothetical protein
MHELRARDRRVRPYGKTGVIDPSHFPARDETMHLFQPTAEAAALQSRSRTTLLGLLDRLADDLGDRHVDPEHIATVVRTLHRCWTGNRPAEPAARLAEFLRLLEAAGPRPRLRELARRCERLEA